MQQRWKVSLWKKFEQRLTLLGIRPETIAEFVDVYKQDYEMFNYRKPAVIIDLGESLLKVWFCE